MAVSDLPENFDRFNTLQTKNIVIVCQIEGLDLLSSTTVYTKIRYGDAGIHYGDAGVVYGGLRKVVGPRPLIALDGSSLSITQRLEPEQGRAAVSTLSLSFIDKDQYMTQAISPGVISDEILGKRVKVWLGYQEISYPEDYIVIFRGRVSDVRYNAGKVVLQFSDANLNRRQDIFVTGKTKLLGDITDSDTTVGVLDNADFYQHILGPDGTYDTARPWNPDGTYNPVALKRSGVRTFLTIDDEVIEYGPLGYGSNSFTNVVRGSRGTVAAAHQTGADVAASIEIQDNAIDMALKLMLSGWNGSWLDGIPIYSIRQTFDPTLRDQPGAIILPDEVNAVEDYGLYIGDYITISGATNLANNATFKITHIEPLFEQPNRIIYVDNDLVFEGPYTSPGPVMAFRSQFDTYPVLAGAKLTNEDVDVEAHITLKNGFLGDPENSYRFYMTAQESLKSFIESEIFLPVAAYSLTKRGKLSIGYTKPPIADQRLVVLTQDNIASPEQINLQRGLNSRKFFNEIDWQWDYDDHGTAVSYFRVLDADSLNRIGVLSILPINSRGARTDLGTNTLFSKRSNFLLSRYRYAAPELQGVKVFYGTVAQIESGDIVAVQDDKTLQIANMATGERDLGTQLFEVVDRQFDIRNGMGTLRLIAGLAYDVTDRYATISPSSIISTGSTTDYIIIQDSYGVIFPANERKKWKDYLGMPVVIHDEDYTTEYTATLDRFDPVNPYKIYVRDLATAPPAGFIVDIPPYPDTLSKTDSSLYKVIHAFWSARYAVVSGASNTQFDVSVPDSARFFEGAHLIVHKEDWTTYSAEVKVLTVTGTTINVDTDMGFTPDSTYYVSLIAMPDHAGAYRFI